MPAEQRGQPYRLGPGRWGLRYRDASGARKRKSGFASRSEAYAHYRDVIRPQLLGLPGHTADVTFGVVRASSGVTPCAHEASSTGATLRDWLVRPRKAFGRTKLRELERMGADLTDFDLRLCRPRYLRYTVMRAMRQVCGYGVGERQKMMHNPAATAGSYPQPKRSSPIRVYTPDELEILCAELGPKGVRQRSHSPPRPACSERVGPGRASATSTVRGFVLRRARYEGRGIPPGGAADRSVALGAIEAVPPAPGYPPCSSPACAEALPRPAQLPQQVLRAGGRVGRDRDDRHGHTTALEPSPRTRSPLE